MILQAGYDCYLTQAAELPLSERRFENQIYVRDYEEVRQWREITSREKDRIIVMAGFIGEDGISVATLYKVDMLLNVIQDNINLSSLSPNDALAKKDYYPSWQSMVGKEVKAGWRLLHDGTLYEAIQDHTAQEDWVPGTGTESLYKVVQAEHEGTAEGPIPWEQGMELHEGKHYTDKGVIYLCTRSSEIGMSFDLADLVSGGFVHQLTANEDSEINNETVIND